MSGEVCQYRTCHRQSPYTFPAQRSVLHSSDLRPEEAHPHLCDDGESATCVSRSPTVTLIFFQAYYTPNKGRANFTVTLGALVRKIETTKDANGTIHATGVYFSEGEKVYFVRAAREVIVSAGYGRRTCQFLLLLTPIRMQRSEDPTSPRAFRHRSKERTRQD